MGEERGSENLDYQRDGYAVLRNLAPREVRCGLLGLITDRIAQPGAADRLATRPTINTKASIEFHSMQFNVVLGFHWGLAANMAENSGKRLAPSYCFFRACQQGDACRVHSDRPSCEHSVSLTLGYCDDLVWDFEIGKIRFTYQEACKLRFADDFGDEKSSHLQLNPGDAVAYRGVEFRHGRTAPNPNR
jgi:hypothetical protein